VILFASLLAWESFVRLEIDRFHKETGYANVAKGTPEGAYSALRELLVKRDAYRYSVAAWQSDELSLTLVDVFARAYDESRNVSILQPRSPKIVAIGETILKDRLQTIMLDPQDPKSLESLVRKGDEALRNGDRRAAEESFEAAETCIASAANELAHAPESARGSEWLKEAVGRLDRAQARSRVGLVRALPLSEKAREKLEELVGTHVPNLDMPKKN
jgi:hypothetical protein